MTSRVTISVEHLSKRYQLGTIGYGSLQHDLTGWWARIRGKEDPNAKIGEKSRLDLRGDFWALRDLNLEVNQGDRVGIIGRNGAGKSTLLKLLSRVTSPTSGRIKVRGRIASLLEVGTGFHPELTGRENVFLNGAILGMKRREIQSKFDEIVAFAGVDQFIDTPVKRYSSGMYVRLAFSVAAHLDSEILFVDEVLAVGDVEFQKKCIGKMDNLSRSSGKTILFVSHQLNTLQALCNRGIYLENGSSERSVTTIGEALATYSKRGGSDDGAWRPTSATREVPVAPLSFLVSGSSKTHETPGIFRADEALTFELSLEIVGRVEDLSIGVSVTDELGQTIFWSFSTDPPASERPRITSGNNRIRTTVPAHILNEGRYTAELIVRRLNGEWIWTPLVDAPRIGFAIRGGLSQSEHWVEKRTGVISLNLSWEDF